ncbi:hypothetical protein ACX0FC_19890, partial [Enterococcus faecium]
MQQLWAEVYELYRGGEQWWLTPDENRALIEHNRDHENTDPMEEAILEDFDWTRVRKNDPKVPMTATEVLKVI